MGEGVSSGLLAAVTTLVNLLIEGNVPEEIRPYLFGGRLVALLKKGGGVRPIVVGLTLRLLTSKLVSKHAASLLAPTLSPLQVGVGVSRGVEAVVHATRAFVQSLGPTDVLVKLDFTNAFNCVRRDAVLEAVLDHIPGAYPYIHAAYSAPSFLGYDGHIISSAEGVQQGDPLGPLLFCLAVHPVLSNSQAEFRVGYLDDMSLGGDIQQIDKEVANLKSVAAGIGLCLNVSKCELISASPLSSVPTSLAGFQQTTVSESIMLGAPLLNGKAMDDIWEHHRDSFVIAGTRLKNLHAHDALVIVKHSLSLPKLLFHLRCTYSGDHPMLQILDMKLRDMVSQILNVDLSDQQWNQAALPVKWGGLGIRKTTQVAPSAYLASVAGVKDLVSSILPAGHVRLPDRLLDKAVERWKAYGGLSQPSGPEAQIQKCWDQQVLKKTSEMLMQEASDDYSKARIRASLAPHAGEWLNAPPISAVGLRLSNEALRVAVGLRLGANICAPHVCRCSAQVDARGIHGLSCVRSAGRQLRHSLVNDIIHRALTRAKVPSTKEPAGLLAGSSLRPDGATLIPWTRGKCLAWDATCPDTVAQSHLATTSITAGAAALHASNQKHQKYSSLTATHFFVPVAIETLGPWNEEGLNFISELGRRTSLVTGDPREISYLFQRLSVAIQLGNAASCTSTFLIGPEEEE